MFFFDRDQPSAAAGQAAVEAENAGLRPVEDFQDPAGMADVAVLGALLGLEQHAVADAGSGQGGAALARHLHADLGRRAVLGLVPLHRLGDEVTLAVAAGDVGHHHRWQRTRNVQALLATGDHAVVGEFAHQVFQRAARGAAKAEGAHDVAHGGTGMAAQEREQVSLRGQCGENVGRSGQG